MFALRATYHGTLQTTPCQLVFGRDAILNVKCEISSQQATDKIKETKKNS